MAISGHSSTINWATSGFSAELLSIDSVSVERASIETTHMGSTVGKTHMPADLYDVSAEVTIEYEPGDAPPIAGSSEVITISIGGGSNISFSGFVTSFSSGSGASEDRVQATVSIKGTGAITGL